MQLRREKLEPPTFGLEIRRQPTRRFHLTFRRITLRPKRAYGRLGARRTVITNHELRIATGGAAALVATIRMSPVDPEERTAYRAVAHLRLGENATPPNHQNAEIAGTKGLSNVEWAAKAPGSDKARRCRGGDHGLFPGRNWWGTQTEATDTTPVGMSHAEGSARNRATLAPALAQFHIGAGCGTELARLL